jgi:hypothetical protein
MNWNKKEELFISSRNSYTWKQEEPIILTDFLPGKYSLTSYSQRQIFNLLSHIIIGTIWTYFPGI